MTAEAAYGPAPSPMAPGLDPADRAHVRAIVNLYRWLLARPPDAGGLRGYVNALTGGQTLAQVTENFLEGEECRQRLAAGRIAPITVAELVAKLQAAPDEPLLGSIHEGPASPDDPRAYGWWSSDQDAASHAASRTGPGTLLLVVPLRNAELDWLARCADAISSQTRPGGAPCLQVRLLPCARPTRALRTATAALAARPGFALLRRERSLGPAAGAARLIVVLGGAALLPPYACAELAAAAARHPDAKLLLTDEDALDAAGARHAPWFKSAWDPCRVASGAPDLLVALTPDLAAAIGHRALLAAAAARNSIATLAAPHLAAYQAAHLPLVLAHRPPQASPSPSLAAAARSRVAARFGFFAARNGAGPPAPLPRAPAASRRPRVSVIIPTRDRLDLLIPCLTGLRARTAYPDLEILVVDNGSTDPATHAWLAGFAKADPACRVLPAPGAFNWGRLNNAGAAAASGKILLLLNNDIEMLHPDWLDRMVAELACPGVGAVGALLLYPHGTVQHAGLILKPDGSGCHVMRHAQPDDPGYGHLLARRRTVSAVTGACIALTRATWQRAGGIEQTHLDVTCSDTDLCLRIAALGLRVVFTPLARLLHHELATRRDDREGANALRAAREQAWLAARWPAILASDPYWSPNLALTEGPPTLACPPRTAP